MQAYVCPPLTNAQKGAPNPRSLAPLRQKHRHLDPGGSQAEPCSPFTAALLYLRNYMKSDICIYIYIYIYTYIYIYAYT